MSTLSRPVGPRGPVATVVRFHERLATRGGVLPVQLWNGDLLGPDDAPYRIVLRHPGALRSALLPPGDLSLGEAYLADDLDVEGSMVAALRDLAALDLPQGPERAALVADLLRLPRVTRDRSDGRVRLRGRRHDRRRTARAVRHHYDQPAAFFRCFLDPALVYSCAYFAEEQRNAPVSDPSVLARAQERKLELICRKLDLRPGERFLDVGCGWGALVVHAARHHGVQATGVTLSPPQAEVARRRAAEAGLGDRVHIEVRDQRDVTGEFDAIASVGMVEHVGVDRLPAYAAELRQRLRPGGRLLNHGITTGWRDLVRDLSRDRRSFVGRHVFPDGALVPAHHMVRVLEQADLEVWDVEQLRPHYARTLEHWVANLEANADTARAIAGERAYRVWRAYMAGSSVAFSAGDLGVIQVLATRQGTELPFGRGRMLAVP